MKLFRLFLEFNHFISLQLNADTFDTDGVVDQIKKERGYNYEDVVEISEEKLPNYAELVSCASLWVHYEFTLITNHYCFFRWKSSTRNMFTLMKKSDMRPKDRDTSTWGTLKMSGFAFTSGVVRWLFYQQEYITVLLWIPRWNWISN